MLKQLLEGNITFVESIDSWEKAVELSGKPLLDKGNITQKYIDMIIDSVKKQGFYIVISEDVAVPHVRYPEGVSKPCISLLSSKTSIEFGNHDNIRLVFFFGVMENDSHIEMLEELATFLSDNNNLHNLLMAETSEDVLKLFG